VTGREDHQGYTQADIQFDTDKWTEGQTSRQRSASIKEGTSAGQPKTQTDSQTQREYKDHKQTHRFTHRCIDMQTDADRHGHNGTPLTEPTDLLTLLHCLLMLASAVISLPFMPFTLAAAAEVAFLV